MSSPVRPKLEAAPDPVERPGRGRVLGIIGGGQLARMTIEASHRLGFRGAVLDPDPLAPAFAVADEKIVARLDDAQALERLARTSDVTTFDREDVPAAALEVLSSGSTPVRPAPSLVARLQDKLWQRRWLARIGAPVPRFLSLDAPAPEALAAFGYPLVHKARRGGYDGRGVVVLRGPQDVGRALAGPGLVEELVDIWLELAVLVARGLDGSMASYPVVETVPHLDTLSLDALVAPARLDRGVADEAARLARQLISRLGGVGIFAVELFLDRSGRLLVNEIAGRPHNTGHWTIDACATSQFEQHVRAVFGLPLGPTAPLAPAVMVNLLARGPRIGRARIRGAENVVRLDDVHLHLYGKSISRPGRKMGHVTVLDHDLERAVQRAAHVRDSIHIDGEEAA